MISNNSQELLKKIINILIRSSARWSTAAKQDNNSLIAVWHANYGVGYLWALREIATDMQIKSSAGIDVHKFKQTILAIQDTATKQMIKLCPEYAPEKTYLSKLGGEGI